MNPLKILLALIVLSPLTNLQIIADESIEVVQTEVGSESTHHIEVITKTLDGKDLPYLGLIEMSVIDKSDNSLLSENHLHPMFGAFFHYGANAKLEAKEYLLKFRIHPPTFMRDVSTKDKWIEHLEYEVDFDAAQDYSNGVTIATRESTDMNITFMVFPAKSMYEIRHTGEQGHDKNKDSHDSEDEHSESDEDGHGHSNEVNPILAALGFSSLGILLGVGVMTILKKRH